MTANERETTTQLLQHLSRGDRQAADRLMPLVYREFHELAERYLRRESPGHTLQPTALVHEAFLKLVDQNRVDWQGRSHFLAMGAQFMRRILVDHARAKSAGKRGGGQHRIELDEQALISTERNADVLAVDEALEKLATIDERQARIVEMRFFGGMTIAEVASALQLSQRTIEAEWTMIRAWLRRELTGDSVA